MAADEKGVLFQVKQFLRTRLFKHRFHKPIHKPTTIYEAARSIKELLDHVIERRRGDSLLVLGPPGSGKSWVVDNALSSLREQDSIKIYLNGFVHTDDDCAILEIALHLDSCFNISLSFNESIDNVMKKLQAENKCVVLILDEFDLFAQHKNQVLLYNLFDICGRSLNPIVVIGLSSRLDVVDILEKRVKSRFSHRKVFVFPTQDFDNYLQIFTSLLLLPLDKDWIDFSYCKKWNDNIHKLVRDQAIADLLKELFHFSSDYQYLKLVLTYAISKVGSDEHSYITIDLLKESLLSCCGHPSKLELISDLSAIELYLLVACKHLDECGQYESLNFELIFQEYHKFVSKHTHSVQFLSKPIVFKALRKLVLLKYLCPLSLKQHGMIEYQSLNLTIPGKGIVDSVKSYKHCPTELYYWVTSSTNE